MRKYNTPAGSMQILWFSRLDRRSVERENTNMKNILVISITLLLLSGCAPVLNKEHMTEGAREFQLSQLVETPEAFKGKLFILGGVIVETKLAEKGSLVEALYIPVSASGYLEDTSLHQGRFLAIYSRSKGILDPMIYKKGRDVTIAGTFLEVRKGKIDDMEYTYPVFDVRQLYLHKENQNWPFGWVGLSL